MFLSTKAGRVLFESFAVFKSNHEGKIILRTDASIHGTYEGIDPMGLFWSMEPSSLNSIKFGKYDVKDVLKPQIFTCQVYEGFYSSIPQIQSTKHKNSLMEFTVKRLYMAPGTKRVVLQEKDFKGTLFFPPGKGPFIGVINMLGAMSNPREHKAALLSSHGFAVLNLSYFGFDSWVYHVNMESFESAVNYLIKHDHVNGKEGISIVGLCKGGQLALCMAECLKGIRSVVGINCSVLTAHNSHFYLDKLWPAAEIKELGIEEYNKYGSHVSRYMFPMLDNHEPECNELSLFKFFKRSEIPFLYLASLSDEDIPSDHYANIAERCLRKANHPNFLVVRYPGAGHLLEPPYTPFCMRSFSPGINRLFEWGGVKNAHCNAQIDAWKKTIFFLKGQMPLDSISKL